LKRAIRFSISAREKPRRNSVSIARLLLVRLATAAR
jgi:hypothetical protein